MQKAKPAVFAMICAVAVVSAITYVSAQNEPRAPRDTAEVRHLVYIATPRDNGTDTKSGIVVLDAAGAAEDQGEQVYNTNCRRCHAPEGRGAQGPSLVPFKWTYEKALDLIRHPVCDMPAFSESDLSDADIAQIVAYLKTIK